MKGFPYQAIGPTQKIREFMRVERIQNGYLLRYLWCTVQKLEEITGLTLAGPRSPALEKPTLVTVQDTTLFCTDEEALLEGMKKAVAAHIKIRDAKLARGSNVELEYNWD